MRTGLLAVLISVVQCLSAATDGERVSRVDITSDPADAQVVVDGEKEGTTPLTLHSLRPGPHHVRITKQGYRQYDTFFEIGEGSYSNIECSLVPEKGILLVTSEPSGAEVSIDGVSLGITPHLMTDIELGKQYRFDLRKTGYAPAKFEVRLPARIPVVRNVQLMLDSGIIEITSEPSGADVYMGEIRRGKTPLRLDTIPKGSVLIELALEGYRRYSRNVEISPGSVQKLDIALVGEPCSIHLTSNVPEARFYIDGKFAGKGVVSRDDLAFGEHVLKVEADGYSECTETVTIARGAKFSKVYELESQTGSLVVTTLPAGAEVYLDGVLKGRTRTGDDPDGKSKVLLIEGISEGKHELRAELKGYRTSVRRPEVKKGGKHEANLRLKRKFTPNVEIHTLTGKVKGVYRRKTSNGVEVEVSPGVVRTFGPEHVRKVVFLELTP